jgi:hypothetical protein
MITSSVYDANLTYRVGSGMAMQLDALHLRMDNSAVGVLDATQTPCSYFQYSWREQTRVY